MEEMKALVLAAGKGKRLQTEGHRPAQGDAPGRRQAPAPLRPGGLSFLPPEDIILVVGWKKEAVLSAFPSTPTPFRRSSTAPAAPCSMLPPCWRAMRATSSSAAEIPPL